MNQDDVLKIRDEILEAALPNVPFDGWTMEVVSRGAEEAGHSDNTLRAVFPSGLIDVLDGFADLADRKMLAALEGIDPEGLRVRDRIREALLARYAWLEPHKEALRESLRFWMFPTRKPRAIKITWRLADRIWDWAGDLSNDYNHYTKRGLLSGVIVSTTLHFMNDASENLETTKAFLDRRIENVMQLGKVISKVKKAS